MADQDERDWGEVGIVWHLRRPDGRLYSFQRLSQLRRLLDEGAADAVAYNRTHWTRITDIGDLEGWFAAHWSAAERGEISSMPPGLDDDPDGVETAMFMFQTRTDEG